MNVEGITKKIEQAWENSPSAVISIDQKINETVINTVIKNFEEFGCKVEYRGRGSPYGCLIVELPHDHPIAKELFQKKADEIIKAIDVEINNRIQANAILKKFSPKDCSYTVDYNVSDLKPAIDLVLAHYLRNGYEASFIKSVQIGMRDWSPEYISLKLPKSST